MKPELRKISDEEVGRILSEAATTAGFGSGSGSGSGCGEGSGSGSGSGDAGSTVSTVWSVGKSNLIKTGSAFNNEGYKVDINVKVSFTLSKLKRVAQDGYETSWHEGHIFVEADSGGGTSYVGMDKLETSGFQKRSVDGPFSGTSTTIAVSGIPSIGKFRNGRSAGTSSLTFSVSLSVDVLNNGQFRNASVDITNAILM